jgi:quercetin dioxygenase-like cupin family protein
MGITAKKNAFETKKQAISEIEAANLWAIEFDLEAGEVDTHWHDFYSQVYVLEGKIDITDTASGKTHKCGKGTRVIAPPRTLHSEKCGGAKALAGVSVDPATLPEDINLTPSTLA